MVTAMMCVVTKHVTTVTVNATSLYVVTKQVTMVTANVTTLYVVTKQVTMITANVTSLCGYQACYHGNSQCNHDI